MTAPAPRPVSLSMTLDFDPPFDGDPRALIDGVIEEFAPGAAPGAGTWSLTGPYSTVDLLVPFHPPAARTGHTRVPHLLTELAAAAERHLGPEGEGWHIAAMECLTVAAMDRRLAIRRFPDVVGIEEICEIGGVKRAMAYRYMKRDEFPTPVRRGIYFRAAVEQFFADLRGEHRLLDVPEGHLPQCRTCGCMAWCHDSRTGRPATGDRCHGGVVRDGRPTTCDCPTGYRELTA